MIQKSIDAFRRDLPELLRTHPGQWVAYHGDERIGFGRTETELSMVNVNGDSQLSCHCGTYVGAVNHPSVLLARPGEQWTTEWTAGKCPEQCHSSSLTELCTGVYF